VLTSTQTQTTSATALGSASPSRWIRPLKVRLVVPMRATPTRTSIASSKPIGRLYTTSTFLAW